MAPIASAKKDWIQLRSGLPFRPMSPDAENIRIDDIAHALSQVGRFTGHTARFYSVAEHSVHVARQVLLATGDYRQALQGLLHDGSEAYLADVAKPVKELPEMAPYRAAEARLERLILVKFGVWDLTSGGEDDIYRGDGEHDYGGLAPAIKEADFRMLATEARDLMSPLHPDWKGLPEPYGFDVKYPWSPTEARRHFLVAFNHYTDEIRAGAL